MNKIWNKVAACCLGVLMMGTQAHAQDDDAFDFSQFDNSLYNSMDSANWLAASIGTSIIDGQLHVGTRLQPEISKKKIGIGFDVPLMFNLETGQLRTEEFVNGIGALRGVRYARFGKRKASRLYTRIGDMTGTSLGYGGLLNNFSTATSFERRKVGMQIEANIIKKVFGIESMYSDFNVQSLNLFGERSFLRPLGFTKIPVLNSLEFGFSLIHDRDQTKEAISETVTEAKRFLSEGMSARGFDLGMTVIENNFMQINVYGQLNVLAKNTTDSLQAYFDNLPAAETQGTALEDGYDAGRGGSIGVFARFNLSPDILQLDTKLEFMSYSDHYVPQFFDVNYMQNKDAKIANLGFAERGNGIYGVVTGTLLNKFRISGGLILPDNPSEYNPALLQLNANLINTMDGRISLHATYIKGNLTGLSDAFVLDENSYAQGRLKVHVLDFFSIGADYYWTLAKGEDGMFENVHFFTPYFGLAIPLGEKK